MVTRKACQGFETITIIRAGGPIEECIHCGNRVAWDYVDHPIFGFKNSCEKKSAEE